MWMLAKHMLSAGLCGVMFMQAVAVSAAPAFVSQVNVERSADCYNFYLTVKDNPKAHVFIAEDIVEHETMRFAAMTEKLPPCWV